MILLDAALANITNLGLDTSPFIYFIERNQTYVAIMREIFRRIDSGVFEGCSSAITMTEVLVQPKKNQNLVLERQYSDLLMHGRNFTLISIDPQIAGSAADLRARYNLRTPDALQVAAALQAGCEAFLTNDKGLQRVTELRVLVLDELKL